MAWWLGWIDPLLLPPPHVFLRDFAWQGRYFDPRARMSHASIDAVLFAVARTAALSTARVLAGLAVGFAASLAVGLAIRYFGVFGKLTLPTITLLAPVSPVAWLPVAIFAFGIGNAAAIFLVFVAIFFVMTLSTLAEIDAVSGTYVNVARTMGASRRQIFSTVIVPAILPGLFLSLRLNLFAAWMIVLIAELIGVGNGLGQVIMIARNTFNQSLTFFTITIIGIVGFALDLALRRAQARLLYWLPPGQGG